MFDALCVCVTWHLTRSLSAGRPAISILYCASNGIMAVIHIFRIAHRQTMEREWFIQACNFESVSRFISMCVCRWVANGK